MKKGTVSPRKNSRMFLTPEGGAFFSIQGG
jgi:hypothetical protein